MTGGIFVTIAMEGAGDKGIVVEDGPRFGMVGGSRTRRRRGVVTVDSGPEEVGLGYMLVLTICRLEIL